MSSLARYSSYFPARKAPAKHKTTLDSETKLRGRPSLSKKAFDGLNSVFHEGLGRRYSSMAESYDVKH